jgi:subtilase family serine protease
MLPRRKQIGWLVLLGSCLMGGYGFSQQTPRRPPSDASLAAPGHSGTGFMRQTATTLQQAMSSPQNSEASTHFVAPTSAAIHKSPSARAALILEQISPASVNVGDLRSYTNYKVVRPNVPSVQYHTAAPSGTSPARIRLAYNVPENGGQGVIAIVDAFHYPNALTDLNQFSTQFGLPQLPACPPSNPFAGPVPCIKIEPSLSAPIDCGWNSEAALDLEWAHSIAPKASLLYVEAASSSNTDLYAAVARARDEIMALHGQLSMSWGTPAESTAMITYRSTFTDGVVYFAATGDTGGQLGFPADFSNVVSVGGTELNWASDGTFAGETGWPYSGGGVSRVEKPAPSYQQGIVTDATGRNTPDISAVSDAEPAVAVLVSTPISQCTDHPAPDQYTPGWTQLVGTSLATPVIAAMVNVAKHKRTSTAAELIAIYANRNDPARIRDIIAMDGSAGGNVTKAGYDNVTGVGAPASMEFDADAVPH